MKLSYFPGCTLGSTGIEYGESTEAVLAELGIELQELPGWVCCGATPAHALDGDFSFELSAHNLSIASREGKDVVVPCAACFNRMQIAHQALTEKGNGPGIRVLHPITLITEQFTKNDLEGRFKRTLERMKTVAYYGCLLVRPEKETDFDDRENPQCMDRLLEWMGADVRDWSHKAECCGGGLALARSDIVSSLVKELAETARDAGAEAIVTACPLCHANVDMRQWTTVKTNPEARNLPVFYLTELLAYCFGVGDCHRWFGKHLISCEGLLGNAN